MKNVLFLQLLGKTYGGVWQVNKVIGGYLADNNYDVSIVSIRDNKRNIVLDYNKKIKIHTINPNDLWGTFSGSEIRDEVRKTHVVRAFKMLFSRIKYKFGLKIDIKKLHHYINEINPDYIIVTHYQILDMIPKSFLKRTIYEHHSSLKMALDNPANKKTLYKYNNIVRYVWLTKKTMENAEKIGLKRNMYIYNPVKFNCSSQANVIKNKKIIVISRLSAEKRITLMIDIVKKVFADVKYKDWTFEIYGEGKYQNDIVNMIKNNKQIKFMGLTDDSKGVLLNSSINLNTSIHEGFCLSILEAIECGVPTISFNFGESVFEEIIDNETGYIASDTDDFVNKLKYLMDDSDKLRNMSNECKKFSKNFHVESVINEWMVLFDEIDKENCYEKK